MKNPMISGINHITISVRDLKQSFDFYQKVLGFRPLMKHSRGAYFLAGDLWFCLDLDPKTRNSALPEYTHFAFSVHQDEFKEISKAIIESGAQIWKENASEGDSLYFLDPNGHKLEIHVGNWQTRIADTKKNPWENEIEFFT